MKLSDYMRTAGITEREMAARLGCSIGGIRKWKSGERIPRPEVISRIAEVTHGAVVPSDFYDIPAPVTAPQDPVA